MLKKIVKWFWFFINQETQSFIEKHIKTSSYILPFYLYLHLKLKTVNKVILPLVELALSYIWSYH